MTINLIPPQKKREQRTKALSKLIISSLLIIIIMLLLVFGALYLINISQKNELDRTNADLASQNLKIGELKKVEDNVNLVNSKLKKIDSIIKQSMSFVDMLKTFNASVPEKVQIIAFQYDRKTKKVSISGQAETRRDIVKLQEKLEANDYFANLIFASSNYSEATATYSFTMTGDVQTGETQK